MTGDELIQATRVLANELLDWLVVNELARPAHDMESAEDRLLPSDERKQRWLRRREELEPLHIREHADFVEDYQSRFASRVDGIRQEFRSHRISNRDVDTLFQSPHKKRGVVLLILGLRSMADQLDLFYDTGELAWRT